MLLLLLACQPSKVSDIEVTVSTVIPTVVNVAWVSEEAAWVEYGLDESLGWEAHPSDDGGASVSLLGLPPETDVYLRVVTESDPEGEILTAHTGALSSEIPLITAEGTNDQFILTTFLGALTGPAMIDPQGRVVWFYEDTHELDVYRMRISNDRKWILYNAGSVSGDPADNSVLVKVSLDGTEVQEVVVPFLAHDFVELPDGTIAAMAVEYRELDGEQIRGDQIVEIAPDGTQTSVWSAWDCFDPATDIGTDAEQGWTFGNALDYRASDDSYYLSLRNFSSIVRIDRATGTCPWVFGDTAATVSPGAGSDSFLHEHQFEWTDAGTLLVFDNDGAVGNESRVLEYSFSGSEATEIWSYYADNAPYTFVLGEPHRLADGDTFVDWAVAGQMDRVAPDGTLEWRLTSAVGGAFGFSLVQPTP